MSSRAYVVITVAFVLAAKVCSAQSTPQYGVKEPEPRTGSHIKRYVAEGSRIPVNRTYEELTPEEKVAVNSYYEYVPPGDEPPFPLNGLKPIYGAIAAVQQRLLIKGQLVLVASVDAEGNVSEIKTVGSPSPEMTQAAARIIMFSKFKPARCAGVPCSMDFPFRLAFAVD